MSPSKKSKNKWELLSQASNVSGIEFRDSATSELVHFIAINHQEVLDKQETFRLAIKVDKDGSFDMLQKQTFEEATQIKRRYQQLLYGPAASSSSSSTNRRPQTHILSGLKLNQASQEAVTPAALPASKQTKSPSPLPSPPRPKPKPKPRPKSKPVTSSEPVINTPLASLPAPACPKLVSAVPSTSQFSKADSELASVSATSTLSSAPTMVIKAAHEPLPARPYTVVRTMKELEKHPNLGAVDTKQIKLMLKSAPPGSNIVLSNGTVIRKSRRGGARAGAGRKRSRPLQGGQPGSSNTSYAGSPSKSEISFDGSLNQSKGSTTPTIPPTTTPAVLEPSNQ